MSEDLTRQEQLCLDIARNWNACDRLFDGSGWERTAERLVDLGLLDRVEIDGKVQGYKVKAA